MENETKSKEAMDRATEKSKHTALKKYPLLLPPCLFDLRTSPILCELVYPVIWPCSCFLLYRSDSRSFYLTHSYTPYHTIPYYLNIYNNLFVCMLFFSVLSSFFRLVFNVYGFVFHSSKPISEELTSVAHNGRLFGSDRCQIR